MRTGDGGWSQIQAIFGKPLKRLAVPGRDHDGSQRIEADFADGTSICARGLTLERAWEAVWRHRFPANES